MIRESRNRALVVVLAADAHCRRACRDRLFHGLDLDQASAGLPFTNSGMAFDPRPAFTFLEVAGIVAIVLSVVLIAFIGFNIWPAH